MKQEKAKEAYWQTFIRLMLENKTEEEIRRDRLYWSSWRGKRYEAKEKSNRDHQEVQEKIHACELSYR